MNPLLRRPLLFIMLLVGVFATWLIFWPIYEAWDMWAIAPIEEEIGDIILGIIILYVDFRMGIRII